MVCALVFALACLAAMSLASAASREEGGILYIPSAASIAHCQSSCGGVDISYPFGIGAGCFRRGFELTCNHTTQPPKLFLGNSTTQITSMSGTSVSIPAMFFNCSLEKSVTNTYNISWYAPAKGITISSYHTSFYFLGCDFDVELLDHVRNPIGSCLSRCYGKVLPKQGPCINGFGCCSISLQDDISGFQGTIARASDILAAPSHPLHPGIIMAFMWEDGGSDMQADAIGLLSNWNPSKIDDALTAVLDVAIMDQPNCARAQMNNASYACANGTSCEEELCHYGRDEISRVLKLGHSGKPLFPECHGEIHSGKKNTRGSKALPSARADLALGE